ncbi:MAG TPA: hypothetical protein VM553_22010 [Dongiaceae bacterium]|nr:hypothetical protein [Dongiaceae bacterium]
MPADPFTRYTLAAIAAVCSLLALMLLHGEGASSAPLLLVLVSGVLWCLALGVSGTQKSEAEKGGLSHGHDTAPLDPMTDPLGRFFNHLLGSLDQTWLVFRKHFRHTEKSLHNVDASLQKAMELTRNTGLLAANAMVASASSGEIGRGFVTVSQDLIDISARSGGDLQRLQQLVSNLAHELDRLGSLVEHPLEFWVVSSAGLPVRELINLRAGIAVCQHELRALAERYRRSPQQDVRWLQLGDAIKRLLNELINTLFQLELHLDDVLSDMRLLKLAEGPGSGHQIVEIKDRIQITREPGGLPQKFIS